MKQRSKQLVLVLTVGLLTIAALSGEGRTAVRRVIAKLTGHPTTASSAAAGEAVGAAQANPDIEQRARARHGWSDTILNSVVQGAITYYDRAGTVTDQADLTVYRAYPGRLRVEWNRGGVVEAAGFNGVNAWRAGSTGVSPARARDIRAWLRAWPDRLFITRRAGAQYVEAGERSESSKPGRPWQGPTRIEPPVEYEEVELQDVVGPAAPPGQGGDRRSVFYYVNSDTATIEAARWLEPDNPLQALTDPDAPKLDVRVDFGDWRQVGTVLWPYEIVHWRGGKVDYRITVSQVQMNQPLADLIFQNPNN